MTSFFKEKFSHFSFLRACIHCKMQEFGKEEKEKTPEEIRNYVEEQYAIRTTEINDLWDQGLSMDSLDKTVELFDFLDYHKAIDLRMNYVEPRFIV